jgi:hypothetical protein
MADITVFPTIRRVLYSGINIHQFCATTAIKAGQVVAFHATGVSGSVIPCVAGVGSQPIGVALYDTAAGDSVAVACDGCVVYVANFSDSVTMDAGDVVGPNDAAPGGTVSLAPLTSGGAVAVHYPVCGILIDDIAASATGRMIVKVGLQCGVMNA